MPTASASALLRSMEEVGGYVLEAVIGEGGMGRVYRARRRSGGEPVALKLLSNEDAGAEVRERFRREARAVASLRHANIVAMVDVSGPDDPRLYYVMELVAGVSLRQLQGDGARFPEVVALAVGGQLAAALAHAHAQRFVHRDIKPENVLLADGRVVLADFGIVKEIAPAGIWPRTPAQTRSLGTPGFMAPEQYRGRAIGPRTDLFAVGALLYNLTTGHVPYEGASVERIWRNLRRGICLDPRAHGALLSPGFARLVARCIAPRPRDRLRSASQLGGEVARLLAAYQAPAPAEILRAWQADPDAVSRRWGVPDLDQTLAALREALLGQDRAQLARLAARLRLPPAARTMLGGGHPGWAWLGGGLAGAGLAAVAAAALARWGTP